MAFNMGYGSLIAQGVSNTINAFGSLSVTKHNNSIAQAQANIARINAQTMMMQYEATLRANEKAVVQKTMAAGRAKSSQRAALAANGIAVGEGSAAELQASTDLVKEIEVNQMTSNALQNAWGYRMQAVNYQGAAMQAEASKQSAGLNSFATLLGGASQMGVNYLAMSQSGMFNTQSSSSGATFSGIGSKAYGTTPRAQWGVGSNGMLSFG